MEGGGRLGIHLLVGFVHWGIEVRGETHMGGCLRQYQRDGFAANGYHSPSAEPRCETDGSIWNCADKSVCKLHYKNFNYNHCGRCKLKWRERKKSIGVRQPPRGRSRYRRR